MSTTMPPREILINNIAKLSQGDQRFAASLLAATKLSDKQWMWIRKLAERAIAPPVGPAGNIGNVSNVVEFIGRARGKLKYPKIVFMSGDLVLRLSIAGSNSRAPGSVNVVNYTSREWYGRIRENGDWEPNPSVDANLSNNIVNGLLEFAADPAKIAAAYGHLTGNCCFCMLPLTDARSTTVGYGPICAKNYGLPWGEWS